MTQSTADHGIRTFAVVWFGQLVSSLGSRMTNFAVGVWVYQSTGSVTSFGLVSLCHLLPDIVLAPLVGFVVDRWDRRWVMILSDSVAGIGTLILTGLVLTNRLEIWHLYVIVLCMSSSTTFQQPAFTASVTLMIPKRHLGRAAGMRQAKVAGLQLVAPLLAGVLLAKIELFGVLVVDLATWIFALGTLLIIRIPRPEATAEGEKSKGGFWREALYGLIYIKERRGLLALLLLFSGLNFAVGMIALLLTPLLLNFTSTEVLGGVLSTAGAGALLGSILMGIWGGPKKRIKGIFLFALALPVFIVIGGLRPNPLLIGAAAALVMFCVPVMAGCSQALWQCKIPPDLQGRVFAMRTMISRLLAPIAYLAAGPLSDYVFEPLLAAGGPLAGTVGRIVGVGPGRGIGLLFITLGISIGLMVAVAYLYPPLRNVEDELPDVV